MNCRSRKPSTRALAVVAASVGWLVVSGCGKTNVPEAPAKIATQGAPAPVAATKSESKGSPRVDATAERNRALAAAVRAALASDSRLRSFAIDVRATDGVVELFGTVDSKPNREKAQRIAASVDGVKSVKNGIVLVSGS